MDSIYELLWVEKYRPRSLSEIINQEEVVERLKKFVEMKNMPHLLFAGPAGTGKTTAAHALAHDLYGEGYRQYMLELNASVSKHTPIPVKLNNSIKLVTFEELDRIYFSNPARVLRNDHGEYVNLADHGLEVLTINKRTWRLEWRRISWLIRHRVSKILRVRIAGGRYIELTGNHSVMAFNEEGDLVERSAAELRPGDYLISIDRALPGYNKPIAKEGNYGIRDRSGCCFC